MKEKHLKEGRGGREKDLEEGRRCADPQDSDFLCLCPVPQRSRRCGPSEARSIYLCHRNRCCCCFHNSTIEVNLRESLVMSSKGLFQVLLLSPLP